ncbi:MAG: biotin/lipoyl-binding protein [Isosphaeraceae bacterium]
MSAIPSAQALPSNEAHAATTTPSALPAMHRNWFRPGRLLALAFLIALIAVSVPVARSWVNYRRTHSITDDAFVEAHIVNIAPQRVSGRIVQFLVEEDDRVVQGQVVAEVDPIPYRDKVNLARAQLAASLSELNRQNAELARTRKEVPIQTEIARRSFATAEADRAKAAESLKLTEDDVEKGIEEAHAGLKVVNSELVLARADHVRFSILSTSQIRG